MKFQCVTNFIHALPPKWMYKKEVVAKKALYFIAITVATQQAPSTEGLGQLVCKNTVPEQEDHFIW